MKTQMIKIQKLNPAIKVLLLIFILSFKVVYSQPTEDWTNRYNGFGFNDKPNKMITDNAGNIIITGSSEGKDGSKDILSVKYSPEGKELWSARYKGSSNQDGNDDEANSVTADSKGNIYVTGYTHGGVRGRDYCTIKYNPEGTEEWVRLYAGEGRIEDSDEEAVDITTDNSDFIFVTGYSNGRGGGYEYCTVKYNSKGEQIWQKTLEYTEGKPGAMKSDNYGNIIITGYCNTVLSGKDFCTVKYNSSGDLLWTETYNGSGRNVVNNDDEANSMCFDSYGNIYISGYSYGMNTGKDFVAVKYSSEGYEQWVSRSDNPLILKGEANEDIPNAIGTDIKGNLFLTGKTSVQSNRGSDFMTVKIDSKGKTVWIRTYNSPQYFNTDDAAEALATDKYGNVIVTGYTGPIFLNNSCGRGKYFCTIKYSPEGNEKWVKEYYGSENYEMSDNKAKGILIDDKDRIYVMGESMGEETNLDYCLVRYSQSKDDLKKIVSAVNKEDFNYKLNNNFPNPFNPSTKISFTIPYNSNVKLGIYDITGREVAILINGNLQKGVHQYEWNASQFASGTYFYKIQAEGFAQTRKMLLIK